MAEDTLHELADVLIDLMLDKLVEKVRDRLINDSMLVTRARMRSKLPDDISFLKAVMERRNKMARVGDNKSTLSDSTVITTKMLSDELGCMERRVICARGVLKDKELTRQVLEGKMSLHAAYRRYTTANGKDNSRYARTPPKRKAKRRKEKFL